MSEDEVFEMLERCALHAGIDFRIKEKRSGARFAGQIREGKWEWWNPLNDSGDCFKLECAAGLSVSCDTKTQRVVVYFPNTDHEHSESASSHFGDLTRARRFAVVRLLSIVGSL